MNPSDYRLLVSSVTHDRGTLSEEDVLKRAAITKAELASVRQLLKRDWVGFPKGCEAISLTIWWADDCNLAPSLLRRDKDGVLPVEVHVPCSALVRSLAQDRFGALLRWLMLSTLMAVIHQADSGPAPVELEAALVSLEDFRGYLTSA